VIARSSRGDALPEIPLHTVEGSDFFTKDFFNALTNGEADIAVHSLKDMSSEHFFGANEFAVVNRDDTRDVAIFNSNIENKISRGEPIVIGTCSPRRGEMATVFLKKALPRLNTEINIIAKPIRGNVETRLKKLSSGEYNATILATAGINRLLRSITDAENIKKLLAQKKLMLLPLIDCVPAPCQGAIVAEAVPENTKAAEILRAINNISLYNDCYTEKKIASGYGTGCNQQFGVTTLRTKNRVYRYAAGRDSSGSEFETWQPFSDPHCKNLFSSTACMKDFFEYKRTALPDIINTPLVFVANYKSIQDHTHALSKKILFASGTRTWFELAKKGYWVTGCADGMGVEFLLPSLAMPLFGWQKEDITILTHEAAALRWKQKGYNAIGNYKLTTTGNTGVQNAIANADAIFWSSFSQFEFYGKYAKPGVKHLCPGGETAELLKTAGIEPLLFPTIKAFEQWKQSATRSHSVA